MKEFDYGVLANMIEKNEKALVCHRYFQSVNNPEMYRQILGHQSNLAILEVSLSGEKECLISVVASPESEAVGGAGAFVPEPNKRGLKYVLPQMHTGIPSQIDGEVAVSQIIQTKTISEALEMANSANSGIVNLGVEGQQAQLQRAIYLITGKCLPTTNADISHRMIDEGKEREAFFYAEPRLKDFGNELEQLFICDQVVSGLRVLAMIEKLEQMKRLPKAIVLVSPKASRFGLEIVGLMCRSKGIQFSAGTGGVLLDSRAPLFDVPFYPSDEAAAADQDMHMLVTGMFGDKLSDFAANSNEIMRICKSLSEQKALDMGILDKLLPYSSRMVLKRWR